MRFVAAALRYRDLFSLVPADDTSRDQRDWVAATVAEPILGTYLTRVGEVRFEAATFDAVFDQIEQELNSRTTPYTAYAPIDQLDLPDGPLEFLPGVRLRPRTSKDLEDWINHQRAQPFGGLGFIGVEAVFERPYLEKVGEQLGARQSQDCLHQLLTAIELHVNCDASERFLYFRRDATFHSGLGGTVARPARIGRRRGTLRASDVGPVAQVYRQLQDSPNRALCTLALERWDAVVSGGRPQSLIVDAWVGLESLLFRDSASEISYRASLRLAALIGATGEERRTIFAAARKAYRARSTIVHGSDPSKLELEAIAASSRDYLRRALIAVLSWPTPFDPNVIEDALLG